MYQLAAAARRLAARGPLTLAALARELGVSRATLYRRYGSAEGVLAELRAQGVPVADRPARILDAVQQVVERAGLAGFTVEEVAREAEVSPATLYRRYHDRLGLLRAFVDARSGRAAARRELDAGGPPAEVLRRLGERVLLGVAQNAGLLRAALTAPPAERAIFDRVRAPARGTEAALARYLEALRGQGALPRDSDPARLARCFLALLLTEAGLFEPGPRRGDPVEQAAFVARLFWRGASARRSS